MDAPLHDFSLMEPRFSSRAKRDERLPSAIAADRAVLLAGAGAWAKDRSEAEFLEFGLSRARAAVLIAQAHPAGGAGRALGSWAYGAESILALAGKAAAKKALLEISSRKGGAEAAWFAVALSRIVTSAFRHSRLAPYARLDNMAPASRDAAIRCESALFALASPMVSPLSSGELQIHCEASLPFCDRLLFEQALEAALGPAEMSWGPGDALDSAGRMRACVDVAAASRARGEAACLRRAAGPAPAAARPRL